MYIYTFYLYNDVSAFYITDTHGCSTHPVDGRKRELLEIQRDELFLGNSSYHQNQLVSEEGLKPSTTTGVKTTCKKKG